MTDLDERREELIALVAQYGIRRTAKLTGIGRNMLDRWTKKHNITIKRPRLMAELDRRKEELTDLLGRYGIRETSRLTNLDRSTLGKWSKKNRIIVGPYHIPQSHPWRIPWNPKEAPNATLDCRTRRVGEANARRLRLQEHQSV